MNSITLLSTAACLLFVQMTLVLGHGRLMDPPARNAMWRYGLHNPVNLKDNELYCGGYKRQYGVNEGKCGICGDDYGKEDQPHKVGGTFARGVIGRRYKMGQEIQVEVEITANHWGRFELYVCPTNDPRKEATEDCLKKHPLYLSGTEDEVRFIIPKDFKKRGIFRYNVKLPKDLTCTHCVVQWTYYTGHVYAPCENGTITLGCGGVRTFRNCADISILSKEQMEEESSHDTKTATVGSQRKPSTTTTTTTSTTTETHQAMGSASPTIPTELPADLASNFTDDRFQFGPPPDHLPKPVRYQVCVATPIFKKLFEADDWCQRNCLSFPSKCPENMCTCLDTCDAIGEMEGQPGAETWCQAWCIAYPYKCAEEKETRCRCYKAVDENSVFTKPFEFGDTKHSLGHWEK